MSVSAAFEKALGLEVIVPEYYSVMGAIGAALLEAATRIKAARNSAVLSSLN